MPISRFSPPILPVALIDYHLMNAELNTIKMAPMNMKENLGIYNNLP